MFGALKKNRFKILAVAIFSMFFFIGNAKAAPQVAAYYLGTLPTDSASVEKLGKLDLLILSPDQFIVRKDILDSVKKKNPNMIMLAYVPSQSYNYKYWPDDLIYRNLSGIKDDWWLKDGNGKIISTWVGIRNLNMDEGWSRYLVNFINTNIATLKNVDGIFFDMVNDGISYVNNGDVVLGNASPGDHAAIDAEWQRRMKYLLSYAQNNVKARYLVINGTSNEGFQQYVNGRMYETFPTPWENGGNWGAIMTKLSRNIGLNASPQLYVFNSNSNNTGKQNDYRKVRFGLASSLLADNVFFGYDFGDQNHAQLWWYDEYDAELGKPAGSAVSQNGSTPFLFDVWRRDYSNGLALVNPTEQSRTVDLGGEYEKLIGTQDKSVNDGSIVDSVTLQPKDGILLYKTFDKITDAIYSNGSFLRFYNANGTRARNGFFSFDSTLPGGSKVFTGDLNSDSVAERIIVTGPRLEIFNGDGQRLFNDFPLGANYKGELSVAFGSLYGNGEMQILVGGSKGGKAILYNYYGGVLKDEIFPFGKKYQGGLSVAMGNFNGTAALAFAASNRRPAEVIFFDKDLKKVIKRFSPFGNSYSGALAIAAGDFNGEGSDELAVAKQQKRPEVRIFTVTGKKLNNFFITGLFGNQKISLAAVSFNGNRKRQLMVTTKN